MILHLPFDLPFNVKLSTLVPNSRGAILYHHRSIYERRNNYFNECTIEKKWFRDSFEIVGRQQKPGEGLNNIGRAQMWGEGLPADSWAVNEHDSSVFAESEFLFSPKKKALKYLVLRCGAACVLDCTRTVHRHPERLIILLFLLFTVFFLQKCITSWRTRPPKQAGVLIPPLPALIQ